MAVWVSCELKEVQRMHGDLGGARHLVESKISIPNGRRPRHRRCEELNRMQTAYQCQSRGADRL